MKFVKFEHVAIHIATEGIATEDSMQQWFEHLRQPGIKSHFSAADGLLELTPVQRRACADLAKGLGIRSAVVTNSLIGRGIVTAVSWMGADISAFSWDNIDKAAEFLRVEESKRAAMAEVVMRARRELRGPAEMLATG